MPAHLHLVWARCTFHWLVEAERDPENAPVLLWWNGGPGIVAFWPVAEWGPLRLLETSYDKQYNTGVFLGSIRTGGPRTHTICCH